MMWCGVNLFIFCNNRIVLLKARTKTDTDTDTRLRDIQPHCYSYPPVHVTCSRIMRIFIF